MNPSNNFGKSVIGEFTDAQAVSYSRTATTATAVGTITGDGTADVTITSSVITGSPLLVEVDVLNTDTAATWAGKVRTALSATLAVVEHYYVGGSSDTITLTKKDKKTADATLNIALENGTCTGITEDTSSASTGSYSALARYPGGGVLMVNDTVSRVVNVRLIGMAANTSIEITVTGPIIIPTNENPAKIAEVIETSTTATDMTMFY